MIPDKNIERMNVIFEGNMPDNLTMAVVEDATHGYRLVDEPCDSYNDPTQYELSSEAIAVLDKWLAKQGY